MFKSVIAFQEKYNNQGVSCKYAISKIVTRQETISPKEYDVEVRVCWS
jgi:hypothetical protein